MSYTLGGLAKKFREVGLDVENGYLNVLSNKLRVQGQQFASMAEATITSEQLLALNATEQPLVAAPGAGKVLIFKGAMMFLDYGGTAYSGIGATEDLTIRYTDESGAVVANIETTGFLDATADAIRWVSPASVAAVTPVANSPLVLHLSAGEVTTGNSPLLVRTFYDVLDSSWS